MKDDPYRVVFFFESLHHHSYNHDEPLIILVRKHNGSNEKHIKLRREPYKESRKKRTKI